MMNSPADDLLSINEVCRFLGGQRTPLSKNTIYRWVRAGKIPPAIRVGPLVYRWRLSELQKIVDEAPHARGKTTP